ncbi:hypothetical protein [Paracoccus mutanolyticus]|uniref:hypothetical protein n=1 Tax=Paracoccus mutanolyticus TaxID=1499308 RepID=UPI001CB9A1A5|nr:hypothetical protein [Paracoccus mutanolyticus]
MAITTRSSSARGGAQRGVALRVANKGMETGRRFPMDMDELGPILDRFGISVCGGWFSGLLLDGDLEAEKDRIAQQMAFFIAAGAPCIVYGETIGCKVIEL